LQTGFLEESFIVPRDKIEAIMGCKSLDGVETTIVEYPNLEIRVI
jgi:hypothetical protein